jgi:hypothetical protein
MAAPLTTSADVEDSGSSATVSSLVSAMASLDLDETPETPFRYLDLPFDIRYKILNDHVLGPVSGTMLPKGYEVHYQATPVPTALLQVNKAVHDETKAELAIQTKDNGIALTCFLENILFAARILEMVAQGLELYLDHHKRNLSAKPFKLPRMTTLMPARVLKSRIKQLINCRLDGDGYLNANEIDDAPLIEFLSPAILCSCPKKVIRVRAVADRPY